MAEGILHPGRHVHLRSPDLRDLRLRGASALELAATRAAGEDGGRTAQRTESVRNVRAEWNGSVRNVREK